MSESNELARKNRNENRQAPRGPESRPIGRAAVAILLGAALFAFDVWMPLGVAGGVPYVALILLGLAFNHRRDIPALTAAATGLTIAGYYLSPEGGVPWMVLTNRALALLVIWVTAYVVNQWGRNETKLRDSEESFRDLYDNAPDMYLSLDPKTGHVAECNQTFATNIGFAKREIIGRPIHDFFHPDSHDEVGRCFQAFVTHGTAESDDLRLIRKDGGTIDVGLRASAVRDESGKFVRSRSVLRDITDQKKNTREAAENSVLLETAFASMAQGFTAYDTENKLVAFNDKVSEFFGYPPGYLKTGMSHEEIIQFRVEQGFYGDGDPAELTKRLVLRSLDPSERTLESQSIAGRAHVYHRRPMPGGGYVATFTDITELKRAQREAAESSALLKTTFETIDQGFCVYDAHGTLVAYNKSYENMFEFPPGFLHPGVTHEQVTRFRAQAGHFGDGDAEELIRERLQRPTQSIEFTHERTLPNGLVYLYQRKPMPDGGYVNVVTDITERNRAQREAAAKTAYLEGIFEAGGTAFSIRDADFNLVQYNEAYEKLMGFPKEFLHPGLSLKELTRCRHAMGHFGDRELEEVMETRRERVAAESLGERTLPDGTNYVFRRRTLPGGGGYVTSYTDVTALKQARHEAEQKSALLDTALEIMAQGFVVYDSDETVVACNEKFIEMADLPAGCQPLGMSHEEILRLRAKQGRTAGRLTEEVIQQRLQRPNRPSTFGVEHVRDDGTAFIYHRTLLPGGGSVSTYTDITERKQAEEKLRQAQKMEMIGQLTGGVAHDFNNLLAVIMGNTELLLDEMGHGNENAELVLRAAKRGSELTQRLLSFSRRQPLFPRPVDLWDLIDDLLDLLQRTLGKTIEVTAAAAPDLWQAQADSGQVENALLNLALNARDAMPKGGRLAIACANATLDEGYAAENSEVTAGEYVVLEVGDTGTGMAQDVLEHVFEPFYTTKGVGEGSGLGLSMVYGFAKQSGGHVAIDSEVGKGTTVRLYLPRATGAAEASAKAERGQDLRNGK